MEYRCPLCHSSMEIREEIQNPSAWIQRTSTDRSSWTEIAEMIRSGYGQKYLAIGDRVGFKAKDGTEMMMELAAFNPYWENSAAFVSLDCYPDDRPMNERNTNTGGWNKSVMKQKTMKTLYENLPDDLQQIIIPRKIIQRIGREEFSSEDNYLWIPSLTEMRKETPYESDIGDVHFPLFCDYKSRVKQHNGNTWWYWLRSPTASLSANFYCVTSYGASYSSNASTSSGVCFGFCI